MTPQTKSTLATESALPNILGSTDVCAVMREQLEYLIDHATEHIECGCPECQRYLRVRSILLEIFSEPRKRALVKAA